MILGCVLIAFLITPCISQYFLDGVGDGTRADVTFDDHNDRFDITNIIEEQNRVFKESPEVDDRDDFRRNVNDEVTLNDVLTNNPGLRRFLTERNRKNTARALRRSLPEDFAYHDNMEENSDTPEDYERGLAKFKTGRRSMKNKMKFRSHRRQLHDIVDYLHGGRKAPRRRTTETKHPVDEIMLHHAVPLTMKVNGYIQMPVNT